MRLHALASAITLLPLVHARTASPNVIFPSCAATILHAASCAPTNVQCICSSLPSIQPLTARECDLAAFAKTYCCTSDADNLGRRQATELASAAATTSAAPLPVGIETTLPSSIGAPTQTTTPSGGIVIDTTALVMSTSAPVTTQLSSTMSPVVTTSTTTGNYSGTMTYSTTSTAKPTKGPVVGSASGRVAMNLAALLLAVCARGVVFAEL